jgi:hypothetical protein
VGGSNTSFWINLDSKPHFGHPAQTVIGLIGGNDNISGFENAIGGPGT